MYNKERVLDSNKQIPKSRWDFQLENWAQHADNLERMVQWILSAASNYERFIKAIKTEAKRHKPRGFRNRIYTMLGQDMKRIIE